MGKSFCLAVENLLILLVSLVFLYLLLTNFLLYISYALEAGPDLLEGPLMIAYSV